MVQISTQDVTQLASLSALALSDSELEALRGDIANILSYIDELSELNTDGVLPTYQVTGLENVTRDDLVVESSVTREDLLTLAADRANTSIKVPKVL